MKPSLFVGYVTGALLMFPLVIFIILPYFSGDWVSSNIKFEDVSVGRRVQPGIGISIMWLFLMCWSAYGIEVCATFAPEYHDTKRDTRLALRAALATFSLFVYVMMPLGLGGVVGNTGDYGPFYVDRRQGDRR